MKLTLTAAAELARTSPENIRAALDSGDLRSLEAAHVRAWIRSQIAKATLARRTP